MVGNEEIGVEGDLTVEWDEINLFCKRNYFRPNFWRKATWVSTLMRTLTTFFKGKTLENIFTVGDYFPFLLLMFFLLIYGVCIRL